MKAWRPGMFGEVLGRHDALDTIVAHRAFARHHVAALEEVARKPAMIASAEKSIGIGTEYEEVPGWRSVFQCADPSRPMVLRVVRQLHGERAYAVACATLAVDADDHARMTWGVSLRMLGWWPADAPQRFRDSVASAMYEAVRAAATHEVEEWFTVNGQRYRDPHPGRRPPYEGGYK